MANYLFKPISVIDLVIINKSKLDGIKISAKDPNNIFSARVDGETLLEKIKKENTILDEITFPFLIAAIEYFKKIKVIYLIVSNQESLHIHDTLFIGEIIEKWFEYKKSRVVIKLIKLEKQPNDFDQQYIELNAYFDNHIQDLGFNYTIDKAIVHTSHGTPAARTAALLNCIQRFPNNVVQIAMYEGTTKIVEQSFPKIFTDQISKNVQPYALKEKLATISARNLSHTDGSHVMISYQKNLFDELDFIQENITDLKAQFNNLKENHNDYTNYLRGQMEYVADLSGQTSSQTFFDYEFENETVKLEELLSNFLGNGLIDDIKDNAYPVKVKLIYKNGKKIVSIPGGSNGINAYYTIIKNLIRNLYKHSEFEPRPDLNASFYNIHIELTESVLKDYYKVTIYDQIKHADIDEIINGTENRKGIKEYIDDKLLNEGQVRKYGWGILEMKIAACYMIGFPFAYFDEIADKKNLIDLSNTVIKKVFPKPFQVINKEGKLAYEFYLIKPETFLIVTDKDKINNEEELHKLGINFFTDDPKEFDFNTRAKFIIDTKEIIDGNELKYNNIRKIDFFKSEFNDLKNGKIRNEIILEWLKKLFFTGKDSFDNYRIVKLNLTADQKMSAEQTQELRSCKKCIVIDSHGYAHREYSFDDMKNQGNIYYSTKGSKDDYDIPINESIESWKWEYWETIFTKVAVLDERIQEKVIGNYYPKLSKRELLELRGVYIPPLTKENEGIDLKNLDVDVFENLIITYLLDYHYVVLHFTLLEEMAKEKDKDIDSYYKHLTKDSEQTNNYLILVSGKGTPSNLPKGSYFIGLSTLESAIYNLSKVQLVKHLNALRIH